MIEPKISGENCPHCGQFVKLYDRQITSPMAKSMIGIYWANKSNPDFIHINYGLQSQDFSKLK